MSSINQTWQVNVRGASTRPTRRGFGTALLCGYHDNWVDLVREYENLDGMLDDGFTVNDALYKMAQALLSQKPRPPKFKIGRLTTVVAWRSTITITSNTEGQIVSFTIIAPDGTETEITYTILAAQTTTDVATAVELLVEAVVGITSSAASAVITATGPTDGTTYWIKDAVNCTIIDTTADAAVDTDLSAIEAVDDDWRWLCIAPKSEVNIDDTAAWVETRDKLFLFSTGDHVERSSSTIFTGLVGNDYDNTFNMFSLDTDSYIDCGLAGRLATMTPGKWTAFDQQIKGVAADTFTSTQRSYLENAARNANYYEVSLGVASLAQGKVASGEWLDYIVFRMWVIFRIQENLRALSLQMSELGKKIPYTQDGAEMARGQVQAVLDEATSTPTDPRGFNRGDGEDIDPPLASVPDVGDISSATRATRVFDAVAFSGTYSGAMHGGIVNGEVLF